MPAFGQQKALVGLGHGNSGDGLDWLASLLDGSQFPQGQLPFNSALAHWTCGAIGLGPYTAQYLGLQGWLRLLKTDSPSTTSTRKFFRS